LSLFTMRPTHGAFVFSVMILNAPHPSVFENLIKTSQPQRKAVPYMLPFIHIPGSFTHFSIARLGLSHPGTSDSTAYGLRLFRYAALQSQLPDSVDPAMLEELVDAWSHGSVNAMLYYYAANFNTEDLFHWKDFNSTIPNPLTITVPTIVGWGMTDKLFIADLNLDGLSQYVKQLTISKYPTAGHFSITDVPAAVAADIRKIAS
jgi:pimeloyl-ACP methyl ester carboxylesterase